MATVKTVRVLIPLHSDNYDRAIKELMRTFKNLNFDEGMPPSISAKGFLYLWIDDQSLQTAWSKGKAINSFIPLVTLVTFKDIHTLPLLYTVLR